jgi:hypothetical protein
VSGYLLLFWKNPEFLRHLRAELRRTRALTIAAVVFVICILTWLGCWAGQQQIIEAYRRSNQTYGHPSLAELSRLEQQCHIDVWLNFFQFLVYAQLAILTFWSLLCCAQSVSGERERNTWDFQRSTLLSPAEFLVGKLLGEPIVAYFIILCCLPITFLAGILGHADLSNIFSSYLFILSGALFLGLAGLWLSNLFETRSRGIGLIGTFGLYILFGFSTIWVSSSFPGAAGFSPLTGLLAMLSPHHADQIPTIFGTPVSWLTMSLLLYSTFGAWLIVMILQGLKKDFDQIKPLSRWEAIACAAFLNFTVYALFLPRGWMNELQKYPWDTEYFAKLMVAISGFILFAMGLAMITPHDRLKIWWRSFTGVRSLLAEDSPPWPWIIVSGVVSYVLLVCGTFAWKKYVGFDAKVLLGGLLYSVAVVVFVTRDILFLQWCRLTHMRAPVLKGFLYLALYYGAATVLAVVLSISSYDHEQTAMALLTPLGAFGTGRSQIGFLPEVIVGLAIQVGLVVLLMFATTAKLRRTTPVDSPGLSLATR